MNASLRNGVRALQRQIDSGLFMRLAQSQDKEGILALAEKGQLIREPKDVVKDTFVLEFLGLPEEKRYTEASLEQALIDNLQKFLLESALVPEGVCQTAERTLLVVVAPPGLPRPGGIGGEK